MPPLHYDLRLILPALEFATFWWLYSRIDYKRYPALMVYLASEGLFHTVALLAGYSATPLGNQIINICSPFRAAIRAAVVVEIYAFACVTIPWPRRLRLVGWSTGISVLLMAAVFALERKHSTGGPVGIYFATRQFFYIFMAAALVRLTIYVFRNPIMENQDHRAYRLYMTLMMVRAAISGVFVASGGLGYLFVTRTRSAYMVIDAWMWGIAIVILLGMAYSMTSNISCLRPEVAYRLEAKRKQRPRKEPQ